MDFFTKKKADYTLIQVLRGRLDQELTPALKLELVRISGSGEKNMVLDLSQCTSCNSSGLSSLLIASRLCRIAGGKMLLTGLNETLVQLIEQTRLDKVLQIAASEDEAAGQMKPIP